MQIHRGAEGLRLYSRLHNNLLIRRWMILLRQGSGATRSGVGETDGLKANGHRRSRNALDGRNSSAVDDEFGAVDIRRPVGYQESNKLSNFLGAPCASDGNAAE
jgi:hypothetical protein